MEMFAVVVWDGKNPKVLGVDTDKTQANSLARDSRESYETVRVVKVEYTEHDPQYLFYADELWRRIGAELKDDFATADRVYKALIKE